MLFWHIRRISNIFEFYVDNCNWPFNSSNIVMVNVASVCSNVRTTVVTKTGPWLITSNVQTIRLRALCHYSLDRLFHLSPHFPPNKDFSNCGIIIFCCDLVFAYTMVNWASHSNGNLKLNQLEHNFVRTSLIIASDIFIGLVFIASMTLWLSACCIRKDWLLLSGHITTYWGVGGKTVRTIYKIQRQLWQLSLHLLVYGWYCCLFEM